MILKSKHHAVIYPFFKWYARRSIARHFGTVEITGTVADRHLPILLISNHVSWWDGFWNDYLNQMLFRRRFHFMMLAEQLRKYWYFQYAGGFSVSKGTRSIIESLDYASLLLDDPRNMVLVFPQGEIQSMYNEAIVFERGIERIVKNRCGHIQIVFAAHLVDYFSSPAPGLYSYVAEYTGGSADAQSIERSYRAFYSQSVEQQTNRAAQQ